MLTVILFILAAAIWFVAGITVGVRRERRRMGVAIQRMVDQSKAAVAGHYDVPGKTFDTGGDR